MSELNKDEKKYFDDIFLTQNQINEIINERNKIIEPVLNGEKSEMYKAFKDFEERGVFDIKGAKLKTSKNGGLTPTGWKQLQAAMNIYRSKSFETFRYIFINKQGKIADQYAISSHMPNMSAVSLPENRTMKEVITHAEDNDYYIAVCHNHPSGNTSESSFDVEVTDSLDRSLRDNHGNSRFLGHIILDHDTFNLALPQKRAGNCKWNKIAIEDNNSDEQHRNEDTLNVFGQNVGGTDMLVQIAKEINETNNWNDNFIPVVFTNADRKINGLQYFSKSFFENDYLDVLKEIKTNSKSIGAITSFPIITESLYNKLINNNEINNFEKKLKELIEHNCFTDAAIGTRTITEKYEINPGKSYFSISSNNSLPTVETTFTPRINENLFPESKKNVVAEKNSDYKIDKEKINETLNRFNKIIKEMYLGLSDYESERGLNLEDKLKIFEHTYKAHNENIKSLINNGNEKIIDIIEKIELDNDKKKENNFETKHKQALKLRDYLYPEIFRIVDKEKKDEFEKNKIPYVEVLSSESGIFPGTIHTLTEFNDLIYNEDKNFHNRREYAYEKYGSPDKYWKLQGEGKLPEEDRGILFGYNKTNFKFFNIPNPHNPEDTYSYEPSRYDIGDGNGSIFDYVRSTCSHDVFIEALNELEKKLYFSDNTVNNCTDIENIAKKESESLHNNLINAYKELNMANAEYKELHKNWLIESDEEDRINLKIEKSLNNIKKCYEDSVKNVMDYSVTKHPEIKDDKDVLNFTNNEIKKMVISELYLPSRNAQKAMNEEDYKSYNSVDWEKQRKIWNKFPATCNMDEYISKLSAKSLNKDLTFDEKKPIEITVRDKSTVEYVNSNKAAFNSYQLTCDNDTWKTLADNSSDMNKKYKNLSASNDKNIPIIEYRRSENPTVQDEIRIGFKRIWTFDNGYSLDTFHVDESKVSSISNAIKHSISTYEENNKQFINEVNKTVENTINKEIEELEKQKQFLEKQKETFKHSVMNCIKENKAESINKALNCETAEKRKELFKECENICKQLISKSNNNNNNRTRRK